MRDSKTVTCPTASSYMNIAVAFKENEKKNKKTICEGFTVKTA